MKLHVMLLALAPAVQAQTGPGAPAPARVPSFQAAAAVPAPPPDHLMFVAGHELEHERVVKGAPYCADALHETVQTLADGNRIVQRHTSRICRDGQGRTRHETAAGGRRHVFLRDPVAQEAWMLDLEARHALHLNAPLVVPGAPLEGGKPADAPAGVWQRMRGWSHDVRDWGREVRARWFGRAPRPAEAGASHAAGVGASWSAGAEPPPQPVRILIGAPGQVAELHAPPPGALPPPAIAFHARLMAPRGPGVVTALPPETIEGLKAEGRRTSWTIEAGRIGNEKPIVISHEVWTSPELGITLRSRDLDPAMGEARYSVQNLKRGEPDAALFRVPADYRRLQPPRMPPPPPLPERE